MPKKGNRMQFIAPEEGRTPFLGGFVKKFLLIFSVSLMGAAIFEITSSLWDRYYSTSASAVEKVKVSSPTVSKKKIKASSGDDCPYGNREDCRWWEQKQAETGRSVYGKVLEVTLDKIVYEVIEPPEGEVSTAVGEKRTFLPDEETRFFLVAAGIDVVQPREIRMDMIKPGAEIVLPPSIEGTESSVLVFGY